MKLRRMIAIWAAKCAEKASVKIFHRQGVTWAGTYRLSRSRPSILTELAAQVRRRDFCSMRNQRQDNHAAICCVQHWKQKVQKVVCNHTGSNMLNGVVAAFVLAAGWNGALGCRLCKYRGGRGIDQTECFPHLQAGLHGADESV